MSESNTNNQNQADACTSRGVWVWCEQNAGAPLRVSLEALGEGRRLADQLGVPLSALLLGYHLGAMADLLIAHGADQVYLAEDPSLQVYQDESYTEIVAQLIQKEQPEIVLFGGSTYGRSLAPRLAARIHTGLAADCTSFAIDTEQRLLLQTRPTYGGSLMATIICPDQRPQMATIRPKAMKALPQDDTRTGKVIRPEVCLPADLKTTVVEVVADVNKMVNLADADIIVAGGRGIGDQANFAILEDLARTLGAAVGATRAVVDAGWIAYNHQVGQTGKTVRPKIYFACGISGAAQHLAGMSSSDIIIAINKDPDAPIFQVATYGLVGNLLEIVPALTREFKARATQG